MVIIAVYMFAGAMIVASIPILKLIGWWIEGSIEPGMALFAILLYVGLLAMIIGAGSVALGLIALLVILASAILMPYIGQITEQAQRKHIEDDRLQSYIRALEQNPMDPVARIALAEALYKRGETDQAIQHMEWTLQQFPRLSPRIRTQLASWKREQQRQGMERPIFCHMCHAENPPGVTHCHQCGAAFGTKSGILERLAREGGPRVVIRGWIVTATALLLACFALLYLPALIAGPIILGAVLVGAWLFLRWVGGDLGVSEDPAKIPPP